MAQRISDLAFVTFYHPGGEHKPDYNNLINWNTGEHRRKYLKQNGLYLNDLSDITPSQGELFFWGEWEPESKAKEIRLPKFNGPRYIYTPYYVPRDNYTAFQNTDPYVYGDHFHYTCCLQHQGKKYSPTQLRYLKRGSVILFGSEIDGSFVLDTVFVVGKSIEHHIDNYQQTLTGQISQTYNDVSIAPLYQGNEQACCGSKTKAKGICQANGSFRLYFGVNYNERNNYEGMFSFTPCLPPPKGEKGFLRPTINMPNVISIGQNQGFRFKILQEIMTAKQLWTRVVEQVLTQGLNLGVYIYEPHPLNPVNRLF